MIMVFKKGNTHAFHGTQCKLERITVSQLRGYEKDGWTTDYRELSLDPKVKEELKAEAKARSEKKTQQG